MSQAQLCVHKCLSLIHSTWVLTFDSLGGSHKAVHTVLNRWLQHEARNKLNLTQEFSPSLYWEARVSLLGFIDQWSHKQVPVQNNSSDCGLFVIHYATQLVQRYHEILPFIQVSCTPRLELVADI